MLAAAAALPSPLAAQDQPEAAPVIDVDLALAPFVPHRNVVTLGSLSETVRDRVPAELFSGTEAQDAAVIADALAAHDKDQVVPYDSEKPLDLGGSQFVILQVAVPPSLVHYNACRGSKVVRCPDPLKLTEQLQPISQALPEPTEREVMPRPLFNHRVLVRLSSGEWVRWTAPFVRGARSFLARPGAAPWQAQVQRPVRVPAFNFALGWQSRLYCGGALIAPQWVLTAAHCLIDKDAGVHNIAGKGYRIRLGVHNISNETEGVSFRIVRAVAHPDYNPVTLAHDIALIQIAPDRDTKRGNALWIQSIPVDANKAQTERFTGKDSFFYGWGLTETKKVTAGLQIAVMRILPDASCTNPAIALCGVGAGKRRATQCHGDSGGPLVAFEKARPPLLIGVVSHNVGKMECGENLRPGVFTRVGFYRPWIEGITGKLPAPGVLGDPLLNW